MNQRDWEEKAIIQELRQEQRKREMWLRYVVTTSVNERNAFAYEVQRRAIYEVSTRFDIEIRTTSHKCPYDLVLGSRVLAEVKGSHWQQGKRGRYQANIRSYVADVVLFDAINGTDHWFVIPMSAIVSRRTIEVYSYCLEFPTGRWAAFLERWDILFEIIEKSPRRAVQLEMGGLREKSMRSKSKSIQ